MKSTAPLLAQWTDEGSFLISRRHAKECDARFVVGEYYMIEAEERRSEKAHRSFFASITESWKNLPEDQAERWPSPDHLRRYALIKGGFCDRRDVVCANNNEALRLAALVKLLDSYSLATVSERSVSVWTAQSQNYKSMGKKRFHESQNAVREFCAAVIGVSPETLDREAGASA